MIIKRLNGVQGIQVEGFENVTKKVMLGINDGCNQIVMQHFRIEPEGTTPHHTHDFSHLIKVESGQGVLVDGHGDEHDLIEGDFLYINNNEPHNFKNTGQEPFCYICVVPGVGEGYS